jgi:hypothetical protein
MPAESSQPGSGGFTAEERAAMKARAAELRAEGKKGARKADGLQEVLAKIAQMGTPAVEEKITELVKTAVS